MKIEIIKSLTNNFESYAKKTENDVEFWLARDLQSLLEDRWSTSYLFVNILPSKQCRVNCMKIILFFASTVSLLSILCLSGCGQSGPLYLPHPATSTSTKAPAPLKNIHKPSNKTKA